MSLKGFSASVDEAKEQAAKNGEDLSERNQAGDGDTLDEDSQHQQLLLGPQVQLVEGDNGSDSQVESRTPPAMERNLFLSALANGKLAVSVVLSPTLKNSTNCITSTTSEPSESVEAYKYIHDYQTYSTIPCAVRPLSLSLICFPLTNQRNMVSRPARRGITTKQLIVVPCIPCTTVVSPGRRDDDAQTSPRWRAGGDAGQVSRCAGGSYQNPFSGHQRAVQLSEGEAR